MNQDLLDVRIIRQWPPRSARSPRPRGGWAIVRPAQFSRAFKAATDEPAWTWVQRLRFECGDARYDWLNRVQPVAAARFEGGATLYRAMDAG